MLSNKPSWPSLDRTGKSDAPLSVSTGNPNPAPVSVPKSRFAASAPTLPHHLLPPVLKDVALNDAVDARPPQMHLLIVEDDAPVRQACAEISGALGFVTQVADSVPSARTVLAHSPIDLVLLDLRLPGGGGLSLLEEIRSNSPETVVMIMTAYGTVNSAVEAMRTGASDYITKPFSIEELSTVLERAAHRRAFDLEARALRERLRSGRGMGKLIGNSPAMEKLYRILSKVASTTHPVLILGESGTGKELVARSIHGNGPTANSPFIPIDCGSLLPALIENELFGYSKGAFPGATRAKIGLLAAAEGGTIFLDEIAELPLDLQTKLLRALQERRFRPMGSNESVAINARILAATNRDLPSLVETGRFRKDLYFRLNVVNLRIPPLRERKADIPLLAAHVLERTRRDSGITYTFSDDSLHLLMSYDWPGNVRELENAIERACALSSGPVLHLGDFPTQLQDHRQHSLRAYHEQSLQHPRSPRYGDTGDGSPGDPLSGSLSADNGEHGVLSIAELEKQAILKTIRELNGDKLMAARLLGIGKTTLYRKLKEYGVDEQRIL